LGEANTKEHPSYFANGDSRNMLPKSQKFISLAMKIWWRRWKEVRWLLSWKRDSQRRHHSSNSRSLEAKCTLEG